MQKEYKIVQQIKELNNRLAPQAEVFLFGSRARGAQAISDWDLLVLINAPTISFDAETQFMNEFYDLELKTGAVISPLIYTQNQWQHTRTNTPLFENIQKEGIRLQ